MDADFRLGVKPDRGYACSAFGLHANLSNRRMSVGKNPVSMWPDDLGRDRLSACFSEKRVMLLRQRAALEISIRSLRYFTYLGSRSCS